MILKENLAKKTNFTGHGFKYSLFKSSTIRSDFLSQVKSRKIKSGSRLLRIRPFVYQKRANEIKAWRQGFMRDCPGGVLTPQVRAHRTLNNIFRTNNLQFLCSGNP